MAGAAVFVLAGCSDAPDADADGPASGPGVVGSSCAALAEVMPAGAGSVQDLSHDPVAIAASNIPLLTQLTAAISGQMNSEVYLVDTLHGDEFTVFAPVDDAFAALPAETVATLQTPEGAATLTSLLTYHVVPGRVAPDDMGGELTTVQTGTLTVEGSGDDLAVDGATVTCGGIETANATIYLIDEVLTPPT